MSELSRRDLLRWSLGGLAAGPLLGSFSPLSALARAAQLGSAPPTEKVLVIFLRGGMDGVLAAVPIGDSTYTASRNIGASQAWIDPTTTLPLTPFVGLNPGLGPLHAGPWAANELAILHQVGNHDGRRSHFTEMQRLETADLAPPYALNEEGFVPRLLQIMGTTSAVGGTSVSPLTQRLFQSTSRPLFHVRDVAAFRAKVFNPRLVSHLANTPTPTVEQFVDSIGDKMLAAHAEVVAAPAIVHNGTWFPWQSADPWPLQPVDDTAASRAFFRDLEGAVHMLLNTNCRVAGVELNSFDTHENEVAPLNSLLRVLGFGMRSAWDAAFQHPTVSLTSFAMSEFGRTALVNGNNGTDHGLGGLMIVSGPRVQGGVYNCDAATWSPLGVQGALTSGLDRNACQVRTHFLAVFQEAIDKLFGITNPANQTRILLGLGQNPPAATMTPLNYLV